MGLQQQQLHSYMNEPENAYTYATRMGQGAGAYTSHSWGDFDIFGGDFDYFGFPCLGRLGHHPPEEFARIAPAFAGGFRETLRMRLNSLQVPIYSY